MATEHYVADADDIAEGECLIVEVKGREIGVFNVGGRYYALPNICLHQKGPLCNGRVTGTMTASVDTEWKPQWVKEGEILRCPWHSLEFNITNGDCLAFPKRSIRTYDVKVASGKIILMV